MSETPRRYWLPARSEVFVFQTSPAEFVNLRSQFATSSWGGTRKLPLAFTEHGAITAAMMSVHGSVALEGEVVHMIARRLGDHRELLGRLGTPSRDFH